MTSSFASTSHKLVCNLQHYQLTIVQHSSNILQTLLAVLDILDVSIEYKKMVPLGLFSKKLHMNLFFLSDQPSDDIIEQPFFPFNLKHVSLISL